MGQDEKVRNIVAESLGLPSDQVKPDATFKALGADSLDFIDLIIQFEKEFNIEIADEELEKILTVGDAVKYIDAHVS